MPLTNIDHDNITDFLKRRFPDRVHASSTHVSEIINELLTENIANIEDLEHLLTIYPPNEYVFKLEQESGFRLADVGVIRSLLVARKIDKINSIITSWTLPPTHRNFIDPEPFVNIGNGIASHLMKSEDNIKIHTTNVGNLEITFDQLGNRIGTGLPYLRRLEGRLEAFKEILLSETNAET